MSVILVILVYHGRINFYWNFQVTITKVYLLKVVFVILYVIVLAIHMHFSWHLIRYKLVLIFGRIFSSCIVLVYLLSIVYDNLELKLCFIHYNVLRSVLKSYLTRYMLFVIILLLLFVTVYWLLFIAGDCIFCCPVIWIKFFVICCVYGIDSELDTLN